MKPVARRGGAGLLVAALLLSACTAGPDYRRPATVAQTASSAFKRNAGWQVALPADDRPRGAWWTGFGDPVLDDLEARVPRANQNVAAALAALAQAQGLVREQRAALFPSVGISAGATRSGGGSSNVVTSGGSTSVSGGGGSSTRVSLGISASWLPDLFGQVRRGIESARADAAASAADLGNIVLAAQGELANNYIALRGLDAQARLFDATTEAYRRGLTIAQNRYNVGVAARADVVQAEAQLRQAEADAVDLERQRAVYENAIAVLVGENPSSFRIAPTAWRPVVPAVPAIIPSTLAERRPDIAAAERRVAAANARIGVEAAAFFPSLSLSANGNTSGGALGDLFAASANFWSFGLSSALTLLDFGARRARVAQARALYDQTVAQYRQTVLAAFGEVENNLAAVDVLAREEALRRAASVAADRAEAIALNQYKAGLIGFTDVVTLQTQALSARLTLVAVQRDRQAAAVALVQAIGGGWDAAAPLPETAATASPR